MTKTRWFCRKTHFCLSNGDLEMLSEDFGMRCKFCEADCEGCKVQRDIVLLDECMTCKCALGNTCTIYRKPLWECANICDKETTNAPMAR